jgi:glycosyltransferase involved in cell wall biosynthesis
MVLQPTVPSYRRGFFSRLAERYGAGFTVHASHQDLGVLTERTERPAWERPLGPIRTILPGLQWQRGALAIAVGRGDVVVVSGAPRCLSNIAVMIKARLKGARTIWWGHYWSSTSRPWRAGLRMLLMQLADAILFYTDREVEEYLATRKGIRKPVLALNNGIETEEIVRLRKPYDPSSRPRDLLFIGRITPKAELDLLLEALALPPCTGIYLDVIGDGEEEARLRGRCAELGIAERVIWHGGTTDEPRIAEVANACKAFVYPGSVGLSLIHALAYGLPAIVHDNRWLHMPEIAAHEAGENGIFFKRGHAASLADTISAMLSNRHQLGLMSANASATIAKTFNTADMAARFCNAIGEPS